MVFWSVELSEYDIEYEPRGSIKAQALADFAVELVDKNTTNLKGPQETWVFSVDGSSNLRGSGAGVTLEGPNGVLLEQSLRFGWKASNNQAEYEALIEGMVLEVDVGVENLKARSNSLLITGQITEAFRTKDEMLIKYLKKVQN